MPISYGQVKGRKYYNVQTPFDPANPKRSRYAPKEDAPKPKREHVIPHGTPSGYQYHGCRCEKCREAEREAKRRRSTGVRLKDGMAKCSVCGEWKPRAEFADIHKAKSKFKYTCDACRGRA